MVRSRVKQAVRISSASKRAAELRAEIHLHAPSPLPPEPDSIRGRSRDGVYLDDVSFMDDSTNIIKNILD